MNMLERNEFVNSLPKFINKENPMRDGFPAEAGIYLIGETHFNPITREELYFLKVGSSINLRDRMKSYRTSNPCLFHIDYLLGHNLEYTYQCELVEVAESLVEGTHEWMKVDRETYLAICEDGFNYFHKKIDEILQELEKILQEGIDKQLLL